MARVRLIQTNFTAGELSTRLAGQVNLDKYKNGAETIENYTVFKQGGVTRVPGTRFVKEVKDSTVKTILEPFEFNVTQAYIIEFGDQYMRFYKDGGNIESGGSPVEVATPYLEADLLELQFDQSADVLYIAHQGYKQRRLTRTSHTAWTLTEVDNLNGPWLPTNTTAITMTPSVTTGSGTLTASASFFGSDHVGAHFQLHGGYVVVDSYSSATVVNITVVQTLSATTATASWEEGAWSTYRGFPGAVAFHDQAIWYAGSTSQPTNAWRSKVGFYDDFDLASAAATDGINVEIAEDNVIRWLSSQDRVLALGTATAEGFIHSGDDTASISPGSIEYSRQSNYGSGTIQPLSVHGATLFVQRSGRKVREGIFPQAQGAQRFAPDLSVLSEHMTMGGILDWAYAQELDSIVWMVRNDGQLLGMTYERPQDVVAWARKKTSDNTSDSVFESVAVIPHPDGDRDQVWVTVKRTIDGATVRYVEYLDEDLQVDCALTYSGSAATALTGLSHLEGETVDVVSSDVPQTAKTVASGAITIDTAGTDVDVGLHYESELKLLRPEAVLADGTLQGRKKSWGNVNVRFFESLGATINGQLIDFKTASDLMDTAIPVFTGDKDVKNLGWDKDGQITIKQTQPLAQTILAVSGVLEVTGD